MLLEAYSKNNQLEAVAADLQEQINKLKTDRLQDQLVTPTR